MFRAFIYIIAVLTSWANAVASVDIDYSSNYNWNQIHRSGGNSANPNQQSSLSLTSGYPLGYQHGNDITQFYTAYSPIKEAPGWPRYSLKGANEIVLTNEYGETVSARLGIHDFRFNSNFTAGNQTSMEGVNCGYTSTQTISGSISTMYLKPSNFLASADCYRKMTSPVRSQGNHWSGTMMSLNHIYYAVQILKPTYDVRYLRGTYEGKYTMTACHDVRLSCDINLNSDPYASPIPGGVLSDDVTIKFNIPPSYVLSPLASSNVRLVDVKNTWLFTGQPPKTLYNEIPIQYTANVKVDWNVSCEHRYIDPTTSHDQCGLADQTGTVVGGIKTTIHLPRSYEVEGSTGSREFQLEPFKTVTVAPYLWGQDQGSIGKIAIETMEGFTDKAYKDHAGETLSGIITITLAPQLSP